MRPVRKILLPVGTVAAVLFVVTPLLAFFVGAWSHGWTMASVRTGSMAPGIAAGSLVVVEPVDPAEVEVGSVVGFRDQRRGGEVTTHRVVEVLQQPSGLFFRTQGDANPHPDAGSVAARDIVGRVRWRVAGLGSIVGGLSSGPVQVALVVVPLVGLAVSEVLGRRRARTAATIAGARERELLDENARLRAALHLSRRTPTERRQVSAARR